MIKRIATNPFFWLGGIVLGTAVLWSGRPYMETLLRSGYSAEGIGWLEQFRYTIENETGLLFVPICTPLAAGANAEAELKSRYAIFSCSRVGRKKYYMEKLTEVMASGGIMVCLAEFLALLFSYFNLYEIPSLTDHVGTGQIMFVILGGLSLGFLNGAFWALIGSLFAVLSKNICLAYAAPFVLYYVLTMFQARFYQEFYFLSPRYWAAPVMYGYGICILILLFWGIAGSVVLVAVMKRRLGYV